MLVWVRATKMDKDREGGLQGQAGRKCEPSTKANRALHACPLTHEWTAACLDKKPVQVSARWLQHTRNSSIYNVPGRKSLSAQDQPKCGRALTGIWSCSLPCPLRPLRPCRLTLCAQHQDCSLQLTQRKWKMWWTRIHLKKIMTD